MFDFEISIARINKQLGICIRGYVVDRQGAEVPWTEIKEHIKQNLDIVPPTPILHPMMFVPSTPMLCYEAKILETGSLITTAVMELVEKNGLISLEELESKVQNSSYDSKSVELFFQEHHGVIRVWLKVKDVPAQLSKVSPLKIYDEEGDDFFDTHTIFED